MKGESGPCEHCGWPLEHVDSDVEHACDPWVVYDRGAAVAFGLMGMAFAIGRRPKFVRPENLCTCGHERGDHGFDDALGEESGRCYGGGFSFCSCLYFECRTTADDRSKADG